MANHPNHELKRSTDELRSRAAEAGFTRRAGAIALKRRYITADDFAGAMIRHGQLPELDPITIWVDSGLLDTTEFEEIRQIIEDSDGETDRQRTLHSKHGAREASDEEHEHATKSIGSQAWNLADVLKTQSIDESAILGRAGAQTSGIQRPGDTQESDTPDVPVYAPNRYLLGSELGVGGVGRVVRAFDRDLGRTVAMKIPLRWPLPPAEKDRFIEEAQVAGQLEHPHIVPVYDIGTLSDGRIFYTMKRVSSKSMRDLLNELKQTEYPEGEKAHAERDRLIQIFQRVCEAIHYAHSHGVVHRDLKPDNIMVGEFGEVHVMDWGLSRVLEGEVVTHRSLKKTIDTELGKTIGTPAYMPPEQACGQLENVNELSDVYALGATLYEIVTLKQPSTRSTVIDTLLAVVNEPVIPPRRVLSDNHVDQELDHIIMKALQKTQEHRWQSVEQMHAALESYLSGRSVRAAERHLREGDRYARLVEQDRQALNRLDGVIGEMKSRIRDWDRIKIKRALWRKEDDRRNAAIRMIVNNGLATREYEQALAHVPDLNEARHGMASLVWKRYLNAERRGKEFDMLHLEIVLKQYDDGTYLDLINERGQLSLLTDPPGVEAVLHKYSEIDRRLTRGEGVDLGMTPIEDVPVERGRYLLRLQRPGTPPVHVPVLIPRAEPHWIDVRIPATGAYQPGFCYVPGGMTVTGGDGRAHEALPIKMWDVPSFFIQRYPVTFREYLTFLDDISADDEMAWDRSVPRSQDGSGVLAYRDPQSGRALPSPLLIEGPMRTLYPEGAGHEWGIPILGITYDDALAYAAWRAKRDNIPYRLPNELEWERAARGADGRPFPWGDHFDATFCKMSTSRENHSQPEPVGAFEHDRSPFGVRDLAGGVRDFVYNDDPDDPEIITKGGAWSSDANFCRSASRVRMLRSSNRSNFVGFRLAYDA